MARRQVRRTHARDFGRSDLIRLMLERMEDSFEEKTKRNFRIKARYDELMREGKYGHYETMFRVVREEVERDRENRPPSSAK